MVARRFVLLLLFLLCFVNHQQQYTKKTTTTEVNDGRQEKKEELFSFSSPSSMLGNAFSTSLKGSSSSSLSSSLSQTTRRRSLMMYHPAPISNLHSRRAKTASCLRVFGKRKKGKGVPLPRQMRGSGSGRMSEIRNLDQVEEYANKENKAGYGIIKPDPDRKLNKLMLEGEEEEDASRLYEVFSTVLTGQTQTYEGPGSSMIDVNKMMRDVDDAVLYTSYINEKTPEMEEDNRKLRRALLALEANGTDAFMDILEEEYGDSAPNVLSTLQDYARSLDKNGRAPLPPPVDPRPEMMTKPRRASDPIMGDMGDTGPQQDARAKAPKKTQQLAPKPLTPLERKLEYNKQIRTQNSHIDHSRQKSNGGLLSKPSASAPSSSSSSSSSLPSSSSDVLPMPSLQSKPSLALPVSDAASSLPTMGHQTSASSDSLPTPPQLAQFSEPGDDDHRGDDGDHVGGGQDNEHIMTRNGDVVRKQKKKKKKNSNTVIVDLGKDSAVSSSSSSSLPPPSGRASSSSSASSPSLSSSSSSSSLPSSSSSSLPSATLPSPAAVLDRKPIRPKQREQNNDNTRAADRNNDDNANTNRKILQETLNNLNAIEVLDYAAENVLVQGSVKMIDIEVMDLILSRALKGMDDKLQIMLLTTNPHFEDLVKHIHTEYLNEKIALSLGSAQALVSLANTLSKPGLEQTAYPISEPILEFIATNPHIHQHFSASSFKIAQIEGLCRSMVSANIDPTPSFRENIKARIINYSLKMAKPSTLVSLIESLSKLGLQDKSVLAKVAKRCSSSVFSDSLNTKQTLGLLNLMAQVNLIDKTFIQAMESRICSRDASNLKEFSESQLRFLGNVLLNWVYNDSNESIVRSLRSELETRGTRIPKSWLPNKDVDESGE